MSQLLVFTRCIYIHLVPPSFCHVFMCVYVTQPTISGFSNLRILKCNCDTIATRLIFSYFHASVKYALIFLLLGCHCSFVVFIPLVQWWLNSVFALFVAFSSENYIKTHSFLYDHLMWVKLTIHTSGGHEGLNFTAAVWEYCLEMLKLCGASFFFQFRDYHWISGSQY